MTTRADWYYLALLAAVLAVGIGVTLWITSRLTGAVTC